MSQRDNESQSRPERRNQKNIYVQKIKSLMRISQDNLAEERQITNALVKKKVKIHKSRSEVDKAALKLENNRESAKRARLRKKIYIQLLEARVESLREVAAEGRRIESDSQKFLRMIKKKEQQEPSMDEVDRYLSHESIGKNKKVQNNQAETHARMDKIVEQLCQLSMCSSLRNIRELSTGQISLDEIIKSKGQDTRQEGEQLQQIIKEVLIESQQLRKIYEEIMRENENVKRCMIDPELKEDIGEFNEFAEPMEAEPVKQEQVEFMLVQEFSSFSRKQKEPTNIFINLNKAEQILAQATSYLQLKTNQTQQP